LNMFLLPYGGLSRRSFLKFSVTAASMMGLPYVSGVKMAEAAELKKRPPVIWLHFQECTGCSESILRSTHPDVVSLLFEMISLEYHETLMPASGIQAEETLHQALEKYKGEYLLVIEGSIPSDDTGFCRIGGKEAYKLLTEASKYASGIISIGSCSSFGGIPAVMPELTNAKSVEEIIKDKPIVNIPGCPPNPYNFLSTILYLLSFDKLPKLDDKKRPLFAYGRVIHEHCERRPHFDSGRFAEEYNDEGHTLGYCLYKLGCKGPATFANCSVQRFNDVGVWPVSIGHPCIGCTEKDILFKREISDHIRIHNQTPPNFYPSVAPKKKDKPVDLRAVAAVSGLAGVALGAGAVMIKRLPDGGDDNEEK